MSGKITYLPTPIVKNRATVFFDQGLGLNLTKVRNLAFLGHEATVLNTGATIHTGTNWHLGATFRLSHVHGVDQVEGKKVLNAWKSSWTALAKYTNGLGYVGFGPLFSVQPLPLKREGSTLREITGGAQFQLGLLQGVTRSTLGFMDALWTDHLGVKCSFEGNPSVFQMNLGFYVNILSFIRSPGHILGLFQTS